jgi:hypothetical protein
MDGTGQDGFSRDAEERVFLTPSLREARRVEAVLEGHGVDFVVRVEPCGTTLFGSPRHGAAFYVRAGQADYCRVQLTAAGMELGVILASDMRTAE